MQYIAIARYHVQPDAWNEIVGTRWLFIFHDGVKNGIRWKRSADPGALQRTGARRARQAHDDGDAVGGGVLSGCAVSRRIRHDDPFRRVHRHARRCGEEQM